MDLLSLFSFVTCENLKIHLSIENDVIFISYQLERNVLDLFLNKYDVDIKSLIHLNNISHRYYQEFKIHELCKEDLSNILDSIISKCLYVIRNHTTKDNFHIEDQQGCLFFLANKFPSVEDHKIHILDLDFININRYDLNELNKSLTTLIEEFITLTDDPQILDNIKVNRILDIIELRETYIKKEAHQLSPLFDLFISFQGCGYDENRRDKINYYKKKYHEVKIQNDLIYNEGSNQPFNALLKMDKTIQTISEINIYTEDSPENIKLKLLLSIALYNDKTEKIFKYDTLMSLRTHFIGTLKNIEKIDELELANTIISTLKLHQIKSSLLVKYSMDLIEKYSKKKHKHV